MLALSYQMEALILLCKYAVLCRGASPLICSPHVRHTSLGQLSHMGLLQLCSLKVGGVCSGLALLNVMALLWVRFLIGEGLLLWDMGYVCVSKVGLLSGVALCIRSLQHCISQIQN